MNILYALSHVNKSLQWQWFAEEMKNRGINQTYVIYDWDGSGSYFYNDLQNLGIQSYLLPSVDKIGHTGNLLNTVSIIKKHRPDIVHTSLPYGNLLGQMGAWMAGVKNRITTCENASWAHDFRHKKQEIVDKFTYWLSKKSGCCC